MCRTTILDGTGDIALEYSEFSRSKPKSYLLRYCFHSTSKPDFLPCSDPADDRLYRFPVEKTFCGTKPNWDETVPPSEEDMMIMEVTGWSKEQLYAGMKKVQAELTDRYTVMITMRIVGPVVFFLIVISKLNER
ncbi:Oidioi.mRNA.OKI2018_I69.chr1.g54.t1.cds [Oikopleura dioica]|uniref:Oidioi.mRNA.OKI2018_I69.chr1.g54.t1.cds n=1 Tax=Oikopleura dioica TaxID=34765 RepID=A0ABN7SN70_OIKDI|nr:Oidioi.mRNA.OKI2018_I69.chr1.g54.t1.cds [Oikopleura dioica]